MAHAMRHGGLAALGTSNRVYGAQRVMGAAFVALGSRGTALGCLHRVSLFSFRFFAALLTSRGFQECPIFNPRSAANRGSGVRVSQSHC